MNHADKPFVLRDYRTFTRDYLDLTPDGALYYHKGQWSPLYLQTPPFTVAKIVEEPRALNLYVILNTSVSEQRDFACLMQQIDSVFLLKYPTESLDRYIPTLKLSPKRAQSEIMRFKIPLVQGEPLITVYDEDTTQISPSLLEVGITGYALMRPIGLSESSMSNITLEVQWEIPQLKVKIPEPAFEECILTEESSSCQEDRSQSESESEYVSVIS